MHEAELRVSSESVDHLDLLDLNDFDRLEDHDFADAIEVVS